MVEFKESDHWLVDETKISPIAGLATAQEHQSTQPLFGPGGGFFDRMSPSGATQNSTAVVPKTNGFGSFGPSFGLSNGSKAKTLEPGTLGLGNMYASPNCGFPFLTWSHRGNTCFMNSALQCLAHTKELTDYFLSMYPYTSLLQYCLITLDSRRIPGRAESRQPIGYARRHR